MTERDPRAELLERFNERRSRWQSRPPETKRRFPPWLFLGNIVILGLMVSYHFRSVPERTHHHILLKYAGTAYRLSLTHDEEGKTLGITLTVKNEQAVPRRLPFTGPVAIVTFRHEDAAVLAVPLGTGLRAVELKANDSRVFAENVGETPLRSYAESHPDASTPKRRTLFSAKKHIPLTAELSLRTPDPVTAYLDFKYVIE